jgi:hypothetical protein
MIFIKRGIPDGPENSHPGSRAGGILLQPDDTIHAHPTPAEIMLEAGFKALDLPLHGWRKTIFVIRPS